MSWRDIPEMRLDPPEDKPVAFCAHCGCEIYNGEEVYEIDDELIHEDCLADYAGRRFAACRRRAGRYEEICC